MFSSLMSTAAGRGEYFEKVYQSSAVASELFRALATHDPQEVRRSHWLTQ